MSNFENATNFGTLHRYLLYGENHRNICTCTYISHLDSRLKFAAYDRAETQQKQINERIESVINVQYLDRSNKT